MIVMKFGGTSVGGSERMQAAAKIIASRQHEAPVVVSSAMSGVTNTLERLLGLALAGQRQQLESDLETLRSQHMSVAARVAPSDELLLQRLDRLLRELRVLLRGVRLLNAATARSRDAILGFGELMAQEILAKAVTARGQVAKVVYAGDLLVTDDGFGQARPDLAITRERCSKQLIPLVDSGVIPVLGGYLGATAGGIPTTLGRGGSDLSASLFGLALDAKTIEIWTDVDGMMTADPAAVPRARLIREATFREAVELAGFGAKVLHPAAIDPAIAGGLAVVIRNSLNPEGEGTRIGPLCHSERDACAIASKASLALLSVHAPGCARDPSFLARIGTQLEASGVSPLLMSSGPLGADLVFQDDERVSAFKESLKHETQLSTRHGVGLVALVGEGLGARPELWSRFMQGVSGAKILRIFEGAMVSSIVAVVPEEEIDALVRSLHGEWFEKGIE